MNKENLQITNDSANDKYPGIETLFGFFQNLSKGAEPLVRRNSVKTLRNEVFEGKLRPHPIALYLMPFHSFNGSAELTIKLPQQKMETTLKQIWRVLYTYAGDGSSESYAAELLVFKRKIYEQGRERKTDGLPDMLQINSGADFKLFTDRFSDESRCAALLKESLAFSGFGKTTESIGNEKRIAGRAFDRCDGIYCESESDKKTDKFSTKINVNLTDYWLDWFEAASAAGFDFDYLATLDPLSMRCYEIIKLLCYDRNILPTESIADGKNRFKSGEVSNLKINYKLFAKLMPIPVLKNVAEIKTQIENLCRVHIENGFLEKFYLEKNEIIFTFGEFQPGKF